MEEVVGSIPTRSTKSFNKLDGALNFWDMALEKSIRFTESMRFELRLETFNTFNHANFGAPVNNVSAGPAFGAINTVQGISTNGAGRVVQLGGKFYF